jgi:hypothetical protein
MERVRNPAESTFLSRVLCHLPCVNNYVRSVSVVEYSFEVITRNYTPCFHGICAILSESTPPYAVDVVVSQVNKYSNKKFSCLSLFIRLEAGKVE